MNEWTYSLKSFCLLTSIRKVDMRKLQLEETTMHWKWSKWKRITHLLKTIDMKWQRKYILTWHYDNEHCVYVN